MRTYTHSEVDSINWNWQNQVDELNSELNQLKTRYYKANVKAGKYESIKDALKTVIEDD